jgi:hypothetical protein
VIWCCPIHHEHLHHVSSLRLKPGTIRKGCESAEICLRVSEGGLKGLQWIVADTTQPMTQNRSLAAIWNCLCWPPASKMRNAVLSQI